MARLALSLEQFRNEINLAFPHRDKTTDGTLGNAAHAATWSDHNPTKDTGVICAYDLDVDLDGTNDSNDPQMLQIVEGIRIHPHPDLKYLIFQDRMFSRYAAYGYKPFQWRPYLKGGHFSHAHLSVGVGLDGRSARGTYDNMAPWLTGFWNPNILNPEEEEIMKATYMRPATSQEVALVFENGNVLPVTNYANTEEVFVHQLGVQIVTYRKTEKNTDAAGNERQVWVTDDAGISKAIKAVTQ